MHLWTVWYKTEVDDWGKYIHIREEFWEKLRKHKVANGWIDGWVDENGNRSYPWGFPHTYYTKPETRKGVHPNILGPHSRRNGKRYTSDDKVAWMKARKNGKR